MKGRSDGTYRIQFLHRPGPHLPDATLERLVRELRRVAAECFEQLPDYQCMRGTRDALADKVMTLAWRSDGTLAGFCSAVLLDVPGVGEVLHLGLTCVSDESRGSGLTHRLTSKLAIRYLWRHRLLARVWVSNVACVLSSLANVGLHFDDVYPSPHGRETPTLTHLRIAEAIDTLYRERIYIRRDAELDREAFVFRGSVRDTVFQKHESDARFHHRDAASNRFYASLMSFEDGDEVLQVGSMSLLTGLRYLQRRKAPAGFEAHAPRFRPVRPVLDEPVRGPSRDPEPSHEPFIPERPARRQAWS